MRRSIFLMLMAGILMLSACARKAEEFRIVGSTEGFPDSTMLYLDDGYNQVIMDSVRIMGNRFVLIGQVSEPTRYSLRTKDYRDSRFLWIENSIITLKGKNGDFENARITGSKTQMQEEALEEKLASIRNEMQSLSPCGIDGSEIETDDRSQARSDSLQKILDQTYQDYINENPDHYYSAFLLNVLMYELEKEETGALYQHLRDDIKLSQYGKSIKDFLELSKDCQVGDKAEDFTLSNPDGKSVSLSDYRGKYVLLEFWIAGDDKISGPGGCSGCYFENQNLA